MELNEEQKKQIEQQKLQCPFCQIIAGKIPAKKIYEDNKIIAILDINPATDGHVLIMTKEHYPILPLIPKEEFNDLFLKLKLVSEKIKKAILLTDSLNYFIANGGAAGQQAPHFMIHIIPRNKNEKLNNFELNEKEINKTEQQKIKQYLEINLRELTKEFIKNQKKTYQTKEITLKDILNIFEENPSLKNLIINKPDDAKKFIETNEKLKQLLKNFDINEIFEEVKNRNKKEEKKEKEKRSKKTDLDLISKLFDK